MDEYCNGLDGVDGAVVRREKARARELRKSRWWQQKLAHGVCHYCGGRFAPEELTMDHVVPLARGGLSRKNNLVPCCKTCNTDKKSRLLQEWEGYG
ncbi:HNH endonuclease [Desulfurivibrio dismutans]|uniref:HNH endonuclease n=1 Tax=Desulfurivibrio dismutans TaxID=1398908 RepID=UPI003D64A8D6